MSKFTERQKRLFIGIAIIEGIIAVVLMGLSLANVSDIPIFIPLVLLISAAGLFIAAGRK